MKNILKFSLVIAAVSVLATGCIKEHFPHGATVTGDQAAESPASAEGMAKAVAAYAGTANWSGSDIHNMFGLPSLMIVRDVYCNDMVEPAVSYSWYDTFAQNTYQTGIYAHMQIMWLMQTKIASLCNDIIRTFPDPMAAVGASRYNLGAAYAYRALVWLDMARMYEFIPNPYTGDRPDIAHLTFPYLHENLSEDDARSNPRISKEEMLGHLKRDLQLAIELLEGSSFSDKNLPDQSVAYGILARALMWEGDYAGAKEAAQNALAVGSYTPLTEAQWTDPTTGFNSLTTQNSWMLCTRLSNESSVVRTKLVNFSSWMASENSFGYASKDGSAYFFVDKRFYNQIADTDFRKKSWKAPAGSSLEIPYVPAQGEYGGPDELPEYVGIKFRPGNGEPNNYLVTCAVDIPLMRMEEMHFIIAECDARSGNATTLANFVRQYRNPSYTCTLSGDALVREVFFQKRIEFWGEGVMFFDYKRCPDLLRIERAYSGSNHAQLAQFETQYGDLAPWFNVCINEYETQENTAIVNNPDPTGTIKPGN